MGTPALEADYLFLGPLIQARLADQVPGLPCDVCEDADQVLQADKRHKVLMVLWGGERFAGEARQGASQALDHRWLVILAINSVANKSNTARATGAGPLLSKIHQALAGWTPPGCHRPMRRANSPLPPTFTDSKAVYPLGFEVPLTL